MPSLLLPPFSFASQRLISLSLPLSARLLYYKLFGMHTNNIYLLPRPDRREGCASNKGISGSRSQSAQVQERQAREVDHCLNFIENANANERDANICTNLILCFVPFSSSKHGTGKFAAFYTRATLLARLRSGKSCSPCL